MIVVGAVSLAISVLLLEIGLTSSLTSASVQWSVEARGYADACAEAALEMIRVDPTYIGTGSLTFNTNKSCSYTISGTSPNKTVNTTGTNVTVIRKVRLTTDQVYPTIRIVSWAEVAD